MLKIVTIALLALCTNLVSAQDVPVQTEEPVIELNCDDLGDEPTQELVEIPPVDGSITEKLFELPNGTSVPLSQLMIGDPDPKCIDTDIPIIYVTDIPTDIPPGLVLFNNRINAFFPAFAEYGTLDDLGAGNICPKGPYITITAVWDGVGCQYLIDPVVVPDSPLQDIKEPDC